MSNLKQQREILLPLPVIEKIQEQFQDLYLKQHNLWLKVTEIGKEMIKRKPVIKNNIPHYPLTIEEYNFISRTLQEITENII